MVSPDGQERHYKATLTFKTTNNEAEYEALVAGLLIATTLGVTEVDVKSDSEVMVNGLLGLYATKDEKLKKYLP